MSKPVKHHCAHCCPQSTCTCPFSRPRETPATVTAAEYRETARAAAKVQRGHASDRYNTAGKGQRVDLGDTYFRSTREANYASYLGWLKSRGEIARWEYEPETFWFEAIRRGVRSYKPDFKVWPTTGEPFFVEIKAWLDPKSKTKLKRMAKYHPKVRVDLVDREAYAELARKLGKVIPGWEA